MKRTYTVILNEQEHQVEIVENDNHYELTLDGTTHRFDCLLQSKTLFTFLIDHSNVMEADVLLNQDRCDLYVRNIPYHLEVFDPRRRVISQSETAGGSGLIAAPMPGKIVELKVKPGDEVEKGQAVMVIEAMKMQNELNAPIDGVVKEIEIQAGDAVEADQKLALIG